MEYETATVKRNEPARTTLMDSETAKAVRVPPWGSVQAIDQWRWDGSITGGAQWARVPQGSPDWRRGGSTAAESLSVMRAAER
uniref:Uncharacterized protein n=1 Tax=Oryza punctata TaxID=4537 RepID=A0A0E0M9P6_ORYPU